MEILTLTISCFTIVSLTTVVVVMWRMIKRQEKQISDLLDRLTAPDFQTYAIARERKQEIEMADKGLRQVVEEYGDQDSFRIE